MKKAGIRVESLASPLTRNRLSLCSLPNGVIVLFFPQSSKKPTIADLHLQDTAKRPEQEFREVRIKTEIPLPESQAVQMLVKNLRDPLRSLILLSPVSTYPDLYDRASQLFRNLKKGLFGSMFPKSYGSSPFSQSGGAQKKKTADGVNQINTISQENGRRGNYQRSPNQNQVPLQISVPPQQPVPLPQHPIATLPSQPLPPPVQPAPCGF